jgi:putative DNA methylase
MSHPIKSPRKLIEVALPLDAINVASAKEKSIRHGHPSTLHLWWARRPLAAARAVIFGQLVNDPGYQQGGGFKYGMNKKDAAEERKRLFKIIEELVLWENTTNESVLERARAEIRRSWREVCDLNKDHPQAAELFDPNRLPAFHDPFAGGGAIPLEAQRLGLEAYASDLNPVPVLINKAMIEIPPKFAGRAPVSQAKARKNRGTIDLDFDREWPGTAGLAEDIRRYGAWMRDEAQSRIGHLYPAVEITSEVARQRPDLKAIAGQKLTVIAWLWTRTVKSPNPAFTHIDVPLASTFVLCSKEGKEAYIEPIVGSEGYHFVVRTGVAPTELANGTKHSRGANFSCLMSGNAIEPGYIKSEGLRGGIGSKLMAIVGDGPNGRVYLSPTDEIENVAKRAHPAWEPDGELVEDGRAFTPTLYGLKRWVDLFTPRQLVALTTFSEIVASSREKILEDAIAAGMTDDGVHLADGGTSATAYAEAVSVYLAFSVDKASDYWSSLCSWHSSKELIRNTFGRQAIPMVWDFAETNPFSDSTGNVSSGIEWAGKALQTLPTVGRGIACQADAQTQTISKGKVISTDPPYFDNVPYADLSDYFYIWLRYSLREVFPALFSTIVVPKDEELVATSYRHGGRAKAEQFFINGMTQAMASLAQQAHPALPITIYYAFKQAETSETEGTSSTGWETFLEAVDRAGLQISGTWPMRTELGNRMRSSDSNALASSVVLVCHRRSVEATSTSRREFLRELNAVLPEALDEMTKGAGGDYSPVAPVDLSQAIIGPGMAVFSKYSAVLEADGTRMSVRTALKLINRFLAEDDFDADTQWCLRWFEQYRWAEGVFGEADVLARSKSISVTGLAEAGVVMSRGGKVGLRKWADYPKNWDPLADTRQPVWETLHHLIRALKQEGDAGAGKLLGAVRSKSEATRQLAYRLYTLCERQGWAEDARAYNELITSWTGIESVAGQVPSDQVEFPL